MTLERDAGAPSVARRFVTEHVSAWLDGETLESAHLVVSELVTNAVLHGTGAITLCVALQADALLVEVTDEQLDRSPVVRAAPADDEGGLGLRIVEMASRDWGWTPNGARKTIWARIDLDGGR